MLLLESRAVEAVVDLVQPAGAARGERLRGQEVEAGPGPEGRAADEAPDFGAYGWAVRASTRVKAAGVALALAVGVFAGTAKRVGCERPSV